jgi:hypothetical protein
LQARLEDPLAGIVITFPRQHTPMTALQQRLVPGGVI